MKFLILLKEKQGLVTIVDETCFKSMRESPLWEQGYELLLQGLH